MPLKKLFPKKRKPIDSFIKKPVEKASIEKTVVQAPAEGLLCACGAPVAEGQNEVCAKHIRRG